jgi:hypothetical protein
MLLVAASNAVAVGLSQPIAAVCVSARAKLLPVAHRDFARLGSERRLHRDGLFLCRITVLK